MSSVQESSTFVTDGLLARATTTPPPAAPAPARLYVPRDVEEVGSMLREIRGLGLHPSVQYGSRSGSVTGRGTDALVSLQNLDRILQVDYETSTVKVQAGVTLAALEAHLSSVGLSLPVAGDDPALAVGDFASLGGAGITSYEFGLFVDNIEAVDYLTPDGQPGRCRKGDDRERFRRILAGAGSDQFLTALDCRTIRLEKSDLSLERKLTFITNLETFTERAAENLGNPAIMNHAIWLDRVALGGARKIGLISTYSKSAKDGARTLRDRIAEQYSRVLTSRPFAAGSPVDDLLRTMSLADVLWGSKYLTLKSAESFAERMVDSAVGSPKWRLVVQAPLSAYAPLFRALQEVFVRFRDEHCNLSAIFSASKPIRSEHMAWKGLGERCVEISFSIGLSGRRPMTPIEFAQLWERVASAANAQGASARTQTLEGPLSLGESSTGTPGQSGIVGV
jgi:FAD/FMN-containing dehydrogenase